MGEVELDDGATGEPFERLMPSDLDRLKDEELVAYVAAAREAGRQDAERDAVGVLVNRFWDLMTAWVRRKVPTDDVEDVRGEVLRSLMESAFDGKLVGQFVLFLKTITQRRIADHYRAGGRLIAGEPLPSENRGDDDLWGVEPSTEDETALIAVRDAADRVLANRRPLHARVVQLYGPSLAGFMDLPADETAERVNATDLSAAMTPANVHQIWKRFKADLAAELGDG